MRIRRRPSDRHDESRSWRVPKRFWWAVAIAGVVLFVGGNIGARTGIAFLPFDPHHVYAQFGGAALALIGLLRATRE